jgi:hypothetical protein
MVRMAHKGKSVDFGSQSLKTSNPEPAVVLSSGKESK